ncbi:MAG TPA: hypothetical protein VEH48_00615 [Candidatus Nitrosopolaris sp.]|nr:hypothetical protein [Candidatus Nitrosopolaris sp.]
MSNGIISFLVSISASTWIYTKFMKYSGNNSKTAIIGAIISAIIIFFIFFSILNLVLK